MWKDFFKGTLNSKNSANGSAESVEHSIDCKESYMGLEMPMYSFVSLTSLLQKLPLNKAPGPDCISAEHLQYADESLRFVCFFFLANCLKTQSSIGDVLHMQPFNLSLSSKIKL